MTSEVENSGPSETSVTANSIESRSPKRGLAWPWNNPAGYFHLFNSPSQDGRVTWMYNWELWDPRERKYLRHIKYIPMVRDAAKVAQVRDYFDGRHYDEQPAAVLGFNEPDHGDQANMNPEHAADLWVRYIQPLREKGIRLGAPSVTNTDKGRQWFRDWVSIGRSKYGGCQFDFIPLHWYSTDIAYFKSYVDSWIHEYNKPVWVTEFACTTWDVHRQESIETVQRFMGEALQYLDTNPMVERYSWFGPFQVEPAVGVNNSLVRDGHLTPVGFQYLG